MNRFNNFKRNIFHSVTEIHPTFFQCTFSIWKMKRGKSCCLPRSSCKYFTDGSHVRTAWNGSVSGNSDAAAFRCENCPVSAQQPTEPAAKANWPTPSAIPQKVGVPTRLRFYSATPQPTKWSWANPARRHGGTDTKDGGILWQAGQCSWQADQVMDRPTTPRSFVSPIPRKSTNF